MVQAESHWDLCCAVPQTSCTVVCLVTCLSTSSGQCGCKGLRFHCKSDCKSTKLYACPPIVAGLHRRPSNKLNKLDACHRRHLRFILGIHWPHSTISNEALYKRCNSRPLSEMVAEARWNMLGHVLCMDRNAPTQRALQYAVEVDVTLLTS